MQMDRERERRRLRVGSEKQETHARAECNTWHGHTMKKTGGKRVINLTEK